MIRRILGGIRLNHVFMKDIYQPDKRKSVFHMQDERIIHLKKEKSVLHKLNERQKRI